jgi:hypothetical protein
MSRRLFTIISILLLLAAPCLPQAHGQARRPRRAPSRRLVQIQPQPRGDEQYWAAQRSIEAAIQQLEAYLLSTPDVARAATARQQLDALRNMAASAALPEWVRMRDLPLSEVHEWRVSSVEALPDSTRVVIEIACRRGNGKECHFRPFARSSLVLIDDAGRLQPMLDGGDLPADVRRADREGLAAIGDGRIIAVTVVFAPLARGAAGGLVYYRDRNEAVPARFKLAGRR